MNVLLFANVGTDWNGYYHVGDEAMFLEMQRFYAARFPEARVFALVSLPFSRHNGVEERRGIGWPDTKQKALLYFGKCAIKLFVWKFFSLSLFTEEQRSFIEYMQGKDVVHFSGGGNITSECGHWFYYALFVAFVATLLGKPVVLTSQTIGPFSSWWDRFLTFWILQRTQLLVLRESSDTQRGLLRLSGVTKPELDQSLDAAYFLPSDLEIDVRLRKKTQVFRVGVSLHTRANNREKLRQALHNVLQEVSAKHRSVEILVLPHILNDLEEWDLADMKALTHTLLSSVPVITPQYAEMKQNGIELAPFIKALTGTCDFVVSSRYHGAVFALSQNIPVLSVVDGVYQARKNNEASRFIFGAAAKRFLVDLQHEHFARECVWKSKKILASLDETARRMQTRNARLTVEHDHFLDQLEQKIRDMIETHESL